MDITYNNTILPSATNIKALADKVDVKLGSNLLNVDDPNQRVGWALNSEGSIFQDPGEHGDPDHIYHYTDNCCVTDYIPVEAQTAYHLSSKTGGLCNNYSLCFYDVNKKYLSGQSLRYRESEEAPYKEVTDITTPANCAYIRTTYCTLVSVYSNPETATKREDLMINKGGAIPYEPYSPIGGYLIRSDVQNKDYTTDLKFFSYPARLNGDTTASAWYGSYEVSLEGLYADGYRSVKFRGSTFLSTSNVVAGIVYAGDTKESNSRVQEGNYQTDWFTLPITENSTKLSATYCKSNPEVDGVTYDIQFDPKVVYFKTESIGNTFPYTVLPSKIYGVIGDTLQLFNRSIVTAIDPYQWYHSFICDQGTAYSRYFEVTPEKVDDNVPTGLTIKHKLVDAKLNVSDEKVSEFIIADKPTTSPGSNINVLCVGASTTAFGEWASELRRKLTAGENLMVLNTGNAVTVSKDAVYTIETTSVTIEESTTNLYAILVSGSASDLENLPASGTLVNASDPEDTIWYTSIRGAVPEGDGLSNITFVGATQVFNLNDAMPIKVEGHPGWRWKFFYEGFSETAAPFPGDLTANPVVLPDFQTYANTYCGGNIDVVIFNMGTNNEQIWSEAALDGVISNMKFLLDGLHADFENCKVIIGTGGGFDPHNGTEEDYHASNLNFRTPTMIYWSRKYLKAVNDFINQDDYKDWCFFANTVIESDSENIFPGMEKAVNVRMPDKKEWVGTNGVHPELVGYQMLADSFYRCFVNTILN